MNQNLFKRIKFNLLNESKPVSASSCICVVLVHLPAFLAEIPSPRNQSILKQLMQCKERSEKCKDWKKRCKGGVGRLPAGDNRTSRRSSIFLRRPAAPSTNTGAQPCLELPRALLLPEPTEHSKIRQENEVKREKSML